jgi:hypothetical protein
MQQYKMLDTIKHTLSVSSYLYTTSAGLSGDPSSPETTTGPSTDLPKDEGSRQASTGLPKVGVKDEAVEAILPSSLCSITVGIAGMLSHTLQTHISTNHMNTRGLFPTSVSSAA